MEIDKIIKYRECEIEIISLNHNPDDDKWHCVTCSTIQADHVYNHVNTHVISAVSREQALEKVEKEAKKYLDYFLQRKKLKLVTNNA